MCWLYCRRSEILVLWIGSVETPASRGDLYGCGACIAELEHMVRAQHGAAGTDGAGGPAGGAGASGEAAVPAPAPVRRRQPAFLRRGLERAEQEQRPCSHVVPRGGKHCERCGRRIYI